MEDNYRDFKIGNDYYDDIKEQLKENLGEDYEDFFYEDLGEEDLSEKE